MCINPEFVPGEECWKCGGEGRLPYCDPTTLDDTCYCCNGKGHREWYDHRRCVRYHARHVYDDYACVERARQAEFYDAYVDEEDWF